MNNSNLYTRFVQVNLQKKRQTCFLMQVFFLVYKFLASNRTQFYPMHACIRTCMNLHHNLKQETVFGITYSWASSGVSKMTVINWPSSPFTTTC